MSIISTPSVTTCILRKISLQRLRPTTVTAVRSTSVFLNNVPTSTGNTSSGTPCTCLRYFSSHQKRKQPPATVTATSSTSPSEEEELGEEENVPFAQKRLDVAIVGYPNAGKSQLLNAFIGTKVAAVSRKRHTTRDGILGVATQDDTQLVFCDTPGFMTATNDTITRDLSMSVSSHMAGVDVSLVVIDAAKRKWSEEYMATIYSLIRNAANSQGGKFAIVLNKVDLIKPKSQLIDIAQRFGTLADRVVMEKIQQQHQKQQQQQQQQSTKNKETEVEEEEEDWMPEIFYTCAKQGHKDEGVQDVLQYLLDQATPNEWLLPSAHQVTPMDYKARVEEIIREKIYRTLHRELPHQIKQRNRQLELIRGDTPQSSIMMIQQDLMVYTKSHQNLLHNSHKSGNLQRVHDTAVPELRQLFQCEVLLSLNVKLIKKNRR